MTSVTIIFLKQSFAKLCFSLNRSFCKGPENIAYLVLSEDHDKTWGDRDGFIIWRLASSGSFIETVPDFRKMTGIASDGPTCHTILDQVPGVDLGYILTDFLIERRRRKLLRGGGGGGSGDMLSPGKFLDFLLPKVSFPGFLTYSRQDIGKRSTFFLLKCIYIWKIWPIFVKSWTPMWIRAWVPGGVNR